MDDKEKELAAQYHHTVSEQLDSRLSESPRFFVLLVVIGSADGYILSHPHMGREYLLAVLITELTILWAAWYLARLVTLSDFFSTPSIECPCWDLFYLVDKLVLPQQVYPQGSLVRRCPLPQRLLTTKHGDCFLMYGLKPVPFTTMKLMQKAEGFSSA
jgi:hypothetical protein